MSSFNLDNPEHVDCPTLYDVSLNKYRPIHSTDFAGGAAGSDAFGRQRVSNPEMIFNSKQILTINHYIGMIFKKAAQEQHRHIPLIRRLQL